ncbi:MAG: UDP-glucose/GDP-mannose dehydrogenase family protein [Vampirovibrionales bacterium]|nr:UDP-glucose/GDP-mannose dehydrogenase family protein [Vampirovibrionales bacterium]
MNIAVIGSGYVGTVTGTCLAEMGHMVHCADVNQARMDKLQQGKVHFYEDGLEPMIQSNQEAGRLKFSTDLVGAVKEAEVVFLCIGTPLMPNGKPDMNALKAAVKSIAAGMDGFRLIIEKSTMPIKTGEWLHDILKQELSGDVPFEIAAVPQFLREGQAVNDFMHPDRIVIGADSQKAIDIIVQIYGPLNAPILITDINSAELIKHATNAFLATKISFVNSIAQICEKTGADITKVAMGLGLDKRISPDYLQAGIGYGGVFFPKDINSLLNIADEYHINLDLLKAVETINRYQRISFIEKIDEALDQKLAGKTVAIWGLAYRPHTDDMRDAPSISIIRGLENRGAIVRAYDPLAMEASRDLLPDITFCGDPYQAARGADVIAILTSWKQFANINFLKLKEESDCRLIVDGRNLYSPERMATLGYRYLSIGRKAPKKVKVPVTPKA